MFLYNLQGAGCEVGPLAFYSEQRNDGRHQDKSQYAAFHAAKVIFYAAKGNLLRPKMRHIGNTLTIMQLEQAIITPVRQAKPPLN